MMSTVRSDLYLQSALRVKFMTNLHFKAWQDDKNHYLLLCILSIF